MPPSRKRPVLLLPDAEQELKGIYDPVYTEIVDKIRLLAEFPEMSRPLANALRGWRSLNVRMFTILYRPTARGIEIGYVRHAKRRPLHLQ